jgi:hypothetical protein
VVTNPVSQAQDADAGVREVEILVNKRPVTVPARTTGAAIKAAAGVPADDELFRVEGHEEIKVGDDQPIEVHDGERFVATPPIEPA